MSGGSIAKGPRAATFSHRLEARGAPGDIPESPVPGCPLSKGVGLGVRPNGDATNDPQGAGGGGTGSPAYLQSS
ncbi:hypothetical protein MFU01_75460 [Myxococcus fulvus]|uniref:Uncharacterized protein n=1 Tax=Myxococcus fulvus TaxID=33 RepID=A0A511TEB6_MYXFU|nr:hypothetical protein MFU01_75460 [Myxococcus fulvus]